MRNNVCVIYDEDEHYAKKLMGIINDDNDIPYNAQVFTEKKDLSRFLEDANADMLMICEDAYDYEKTKSDGKVVVLCEEEEDAVRYNSQKDENVVGVCKYQPSFQILQSVMKQEKRPKEWDNNRFKIIGVYGHNNSTRIALTLGILKKLSNTHRTLFISFEEYSRYERIFNEEHNEYDKDMFAKKEDLSDAFYIFRQNNNQFHKNINNAINHIERLDYIDSAYCAEDISELKPKEIIDFIRAIGLEMTYSYIVLGIGTGIKHPWEVLGCCEEIYIPEGNDYLEECQLNNMKKYLLDRGKEALVDNIKIIRVKNNREYMNKDIWKRIAYADFYEMINVD